MDDERHIEIEDLDEAEAGTEGVVPLDNDTADIRAAIDEAVHAVEEAERRREIPEGDFSGVEDSAQVELLKAEVKSLQDRSLRTMADFDNYRKRAERDRSEDKKFAASAVLRDVLGSIDNLERAISAEGDLDDLKQGVDMILRQLEDVVKRAGVTRVAAVGEVFDPAVHEAVSRVEEPDVVEPTVLEEFQSGYMVHERLLRPAIVRVAVPAELATGTSSADEGGEGEAS